MKDHHLQLNLAKTELLVETQPNTTPQLLHSAWFVNHNSIKVSQEPAFYNIRRIRPFLTELHNCLSKRLFYPDWTIVMLSWQAYTVTLIKFKALMFTYRTTGSAPFYLNSLLQICVPSKRGTKSLSQMVKLEEWPAYLNPSCWVFNHFKLRMHSLSTLDPLILILTILDTWKKKKYKENMQCVLHWD